jgi:hypothetical protein
VVLMIDHRTPYKAMAQVNLSRAMVFFFRLFGVFVDDG